MFVAAACMTKLELRSDVSRLWKDAEQHLYSALPMVFMIDETPELLRGGCTSFGGFTELMFSP